MADLVAASSELFHLVAQEEHPDQVLRGRRHHHMGKRALLGRQHRGLVAAMLFPEVDQPVGCRVMLGQRRLCGFGSHPRGEKTSRGAPIQNGVYKPWPGALETAENRVLHRVADVPFLRHCIDKPERFRFSRIDGLSGQHQRHRLHRIDELSEARGAAKTRMQAEHHFRKAKARAVDRDPRLASERDFEPAAEAKPMDHSNAREPHSFEAVDHRMRPADCRFDGARIGRAAEFVDIGTGDEARGLCRANDEPGRPFTLQRGKHRIELREEVGRKRVGAGAFAVNQKPGDAIGVPRQLEMAIGTAGLRLGAELEHAVGEHVHDFAVHGVPYTVSISMAPPCPPPIHSVAMPRVVPSRFMALTRCSTMRLPDVPTGWPRLMAPPSTLSLARSICPAAPSSPKISRQNFSSFQAARHPSTWVANASFNSQVSISPSDRLLRFKSSVADSTGPKPMIEGSSADHWLSTISAFGVNPCSLIASSEARITQDAPSVICEELPAVTWPQGRSNTGLSAANFSGVESGRTPSS